MKRLVPLCLALAGCASPGRLAEAPLAPGARYVALGSSYAAGPGLGPPKAGTPQRCARSDRNYATLLAARLGLVLDDQGCSGATTANVLHSWDDLPAQIDAVTADTRLVTVTVGGNDLDYMGMVFGASCRFAGGSDCPARVVPSEEDYTKAEAGLTDIARRVRARAPGARLVFVQYVRLVPDIPCAGLRIPVDEAKLARETGKRLAEITRRAASSVGATVLPLDEASARHTSCDPEPWSNAGPGAIAPGDGVPWHPNAAGHAAAAAMLEQVLGQG